MIVLLKTSSYAFQLKLESSSVQKGETEELVKTKDNSGVENHFIRFWVCEEIQQR